ncbi:MAG TPA: HlyD family secretion protein [Woeseiaceae bacterium]
MAARSEQAMRAATRPGEAPVGDPPAGAGSPPEGAAPPPRRLRRRFRFAALGLLALAAVAGGADWLHFRATHVYTDDSRIAAREVTVSSEVAGRVTARPVLAGDSVRAGDLLVGIDTQAAELAVSEADADLAAAEAGIRQLEAEKALLAGQLGSRKRAGEAALAAAQAEHRASQAELENVQSDYGRARSLQERGLIAAYLFEDAHEKFLTAEQHELEAGARVDSARADLAVIASERARLAVFDRQIAALRAKAEAARARAEERRYDLTRHAIAARFDGVVDQTFVDEGEYVAPGQRLLMYHDPEAIWVDANYKETDFRKLALGAHATITVDAYPDREFEGEVVRLGQAATSEFALLPSPNPSGNFTKVAQRLPVRIALHQVDGLLKPGMMVEVTVDAVH